MCVSNANSYFLELKLIAVVFLLVCIHKHRSIESLWRDRVFYILFKFVPNLVVYKYYRLTILHWQAYGMPLKPTLFSICFASPLYFDGLLPFLLLVLSFMRSFSLSLLHFIFPPPFKCFQPSTEAPLHPTSVILFQRIE